PPPTLFRAVAANPRGFGELVSPIGLIDVAVDHDQINRSIVFALRADDETGNDRDADDEGHDVGRDTGRHTEILIHTAEPTTRWCPCTTLHVWDRRPFRCFRVSVSGFAHATCDSWVWRRWRLLRGETGALGPGCDVYRPRRAPRGHPVARARSEERQARRLHRSGRGRKRHQPHRPGRRR